MPHTQAPGVPQQNRGGYGAQGGGPGNQGGYADGYGPGDAYDSGYNAGQVYGAGHGGYDDRYDGYGGYGDDRYDDRPRPNWGRRVKWTLLTLVLVLLVWSVGTYFWADSKLQREVDLSIVQDRPESGEGTNYLIVGSDSRKGMSAEDKERLNTGSAGGETARTDSMMILHVGDNGNTMVSLPRDSWVTIPSFTGSESGKEYPSPGPTKLNAAYSQDGPALLTRTIEHNTGLKIDHYAEIGFGGFAKIVDAVGGVEMDIPRDIKDKDSGADFEKGKQTLNGEEALAYVRNRKEAGSDLERTKNQQKFLSALANQTATPGTIINPFRLYPTMSAGMDTLIVDKDMSLWNLAEMFWAMKGITGGEGTSMNMPLSPEQAPQGSLKWDMTRVKELMSQLNADDKVTVDGGLPGSQ
ncbi:transcriptional regulator [Streptomyces oceani]|uniref:Transcriptional regulator n=2 Tax=Streptomyces oceani TaxID=1075402 RepID=A0A1E7KNH9_9ACTN|nr:transcriptional regulator [Streptomyces oceani]